METIPLTLAEKLAFVASVTKDVALPRNRPIQKIVIYAKITGDTAGVVAANEDAAAALLKSIRVIADGRTRAYLTGKDAYYLHRYRSGITGLNTLITTINQVNVVLGEVEITIPFQQDVRNPYEFLHALAAPNFASLVLEVDWGAAADLGTGYTITSVDCWITAYQLELTEEEANRGSVPIQYGYLNKPVTASVENYGFEFDLPVGRMLLMVGVRTIRNSLRSNLLLDEYQIHDKRRRQDVVESMWDALGMRNRQEFNLESLVTGFAVQMFRPYLDAIGAVGGDVQLKANTSVAGVCSVNLIAVEAG